MKKKADIGVYIHIPYCRQACHYCDFYFSTYHKSLGQWVEALLLEIASNQNKLKQYTVKTLYFGGGTPSLLSSAQWEALMDTLHKYYDMDVEEFTIEVNPEDMSVENTLIWKNIGCNRLSIGVQSFDDKMLQWMNRAHDATQAKQGIARALKAGFTNINVDMIYNLPFTHIFKKDLDTFLSLGATHYAAYTLSIEKRTVFGHWLKTGKLIPIEEEKAVNQMLNLHNSMANRGYEHYEISNFCLPSYESKHNTNYWKHAPYLGLGSSAHSFMNGKRWHNIANNWKYIKTLQQNESPIIYSESLTKKDIINEKIMLGLRTNKGLDLVLFDALEDIDDPNYKEIICQKLIQWERQGYLQIRDNVARLTLKGMCIADTIIESIFLS